MHWVGWIVIALALVEGGWFLFDGVHAVATGDYVTPSSGEYAGQLGPWSKLWSGIGIDPRSSLVKGVHIALGGVWVVVIVCFALRMPWAWAAMLACAVAGLWYLPFGTLLSVVQVVLLLLPAVRQA